MIRKLRNENGGYALLYVMVVIVVICAIVMAICTSAMENYKAQQDSVAQMQAKYAVMGEVEKKLAILNEEIPTEELTEGTYKDYLDPRGFSEEDICEDGPEGENQYTVTVTESSADGTVTITVTVNVKLTPDSLDPDSLDPDCKIISYTFGESNGGAA